MGVRLYNHAGNRVRAFNASGAEVFFPDADQGGGVIGPTGPLNPVTGTISAYANEAETDTLVAAMTVPPTSRRVRTIDAAIKRLKSSGVWGKLRALWLIGADQQASRLNWKSPSEALTLIGSPQFTADIGWQATGAGQALGTGLAPDDLAQNDVFHGVWCRGADANGAAPASDNLDYGSVVAGVGVSLCARTASDAVLARTQGPSSIAAPDSYSDGYGLTAARRSASAGSVGLRNGVAMEQGADASSAPAAQEITLLAASIDGALTTAYSGRGQCAWAFGAALTDAEVRTLSGVIATYLDALEYGEIDLTPAGLGPETVTADVICYGTTANSVTAALSAARAGASVAIIGGWRDRHIGGMSAGGLGLVDYSNGTFNTGLPRWINDQARQMTHSSGHLRFACNNFSRVMRRVLDPAQNGGYEIPVYFSDGVSECAMNGTDITSMVTVDGRTVVGTQWVDGSYEGDLMIAAGVPWRVGREPAGSGVEGVGGYRGVATGNGAAHKQYRDSFDQLVYVDPWKIPGDTSSGLLDGLTGVYSDFTPSLHDQPAIGSADDEVQAYNFRLSWGINPDRRAPLPTTPPPGFDPAEFELLLRHLELAPDLSFGDLFKPDSVFSGAYDINTGPGFSTDLVGGSKLYPGASYADREAIWKRHWNYILGIFYVLQHHPDPRVPPALRAEALEWGMRTDHYHDPHPNDAPFVQPQMYVREAARMRGLGIGSADNLTLTDHAASVASYSFDHHTMTAIAYEYEAGQWTVWQEGGFLNGMGGSDNASSVAIEIYMPAPADCTNLSVTFAASLTTVAFGSVRMEITAMQAGQTMGHAAAMAAAAGTSVQAVDYAALQAALLDDAAPRLSGETAPPLATLT